MKTHLDVFSYHDFRLFLRDHYSETKKCRSGWSYEVWAQQLGLFNNTSILKVIKGQREAGAKMTESLIEYFRFNKREAQYFKGLVSLSRAKKNPEVWAALAEKFAREFPNRPELFLDEKTFSAISHWWYYVIRQLGGLKKQPKGASEIRKHLRFKVTKKSIEDAILDLEQMKLIKFAGDQIVKTSENLNTPPDISSAAVRRFHKETLEIASEALETVDVMEREFLGSTFVISKSQIPEAKVFLRKVQKEFLEKFSCEAGDEIYQVQTQFFPLTQLGDQK